MHKPISPTLSVSIPGAAELKKPLSVEVEYQRYAEADSGGAGTQLQSTVRAEIRSSDDLIELPNAIPNSTVRVAFLGDNGVARATRSVEIERGHTEIELDWDNIDAITRPPALPPAAPPTVIRRCQFVPVDGAFPFKDYSLRVAVSETDFDPGRISEFNSIFNIDHPALTAVEAAPAAINSISELNWQPVHVAIDGRFEFTVATKDGTAWLWWLAGARQILGLVPDLIAQIRVRDVAIPIPPTPFNALAEKECGCDHTIASVPTDVTEAELVHNPDVYSEDPGEYCAPFKNPERVLSERAFFSVFRIDQPAVSSEGTLNTKSIVLNLDVPTPTPANPAVERPATLLERLLGRANQPAPVMDVSSPVITRAKHLMLPKSIADWFSNVDRGRKDVSAQSPIQWEDVAGRYQAASVARGHILEFRVRWRSNGYSLGTVAKTLTLAPRQTRRIQKIEWQRLERARREERTTFTERVSDTVERERTFEDEVRASLSEWARGSSESSTTAVAGGIGFAMGPVVLGGGAAHANASSSSAQDGGRRTSASEEQRLQDSIRRYGDSLRQMESVVVNEVSQEETVVGTTEVVRNSNYAHSLTVIYYQILRHLRVETAFAGVRECLFVPFTILPFTIDRAYRWRETLQRGLLSRRFLPAVAFLRDVREQFANSPVPPGRRSEQRIVSLSGSIYMNLGIERPGETADDAYNEPGWNLLQGLLGISPRGVFAHLKDLVDAARDARFQREFAPTAAAKWVDSLQLSRPAGVLKADFTLATRYSFNGSVRIDFNIDPSQYVTREELTSLKIKATRPLPAGSVANVTKISYSYQTDHYKQEVSSSTRADDLLLTDGSIDPLGAIYSTVPTAWERQNMRADMTQAVKDLVQHLNEHSEYYHKVIWWNMDRDRLFMIVDGFYVPGQPGVSIASIVERDPIAILGNCIVFRVSAGSFLGVDGITKPEQLYNYYAHRQTPSTPMHVSLPTDGLYAQTLMDGCEALEEHYGNIDWILDQADPELGQLDPSLLLTRRAEPAATTPSQFPATIINLQNAPDAPAPAGLGGVLSAVTNAGAFRDMAGLAGTQSLAGQSLDAAASLATNFGNQAAALEMARVTGKAQATQSADRKVASIDRARAKGLVTDDEAAAQTQRVLSDLSSPTTPAKPADRDAAITDAIRAASLTPGSTVEATSGDGSVRVGLANSDLMSLFGAGSKPTQIGRKSSAADALVKISAMRASTAAPKWKIDRTALCDRLQELVTNPILVNQDGLNLCGPAIFLRVWVARDPVGFVNFAQQLYQNGKANIGSYKVEPGSDSLIAKDYTQLADENGGFIKPAEWMVGGALRDVENFWFDFEGTKEEDISAATLPGEVIEWLEAAQLYASVRDETNLLTTKDIDHTLTLIPRASRDIILLIDSAMISGNAAAHGVVEKDAANHYILLTSRIARNANGKLAFSYWTWGRNESIELDPAAFENTYYGAIICEGAPS